MEIKSKGAAPPPSHTPTHTQKTNSKENARIQKQTEQTNKVVLKMVASTAPPNPSPIKHYARERNEEEHNNKMLAGADPPTHKDKDRGAQIG